MTETEFDSPDPEEEIVSQYPVNKKFIFSLPNANNREKIHLRDLFQGIPINNLAVLFLIAGYILLFFDLITLTIRVVRSISTLNLTLSGATPTATLYYLYYFIERILGWVVMMIIFIRPFVHRIQLKEVVLNQSTEKYLKGIWLKNLKIPLMLIICVILQLRIGGNAYYSILFLLMAGFFTMLSWKSG